MEQLSHVVELLGDGELIDLVHITGGTQIEVENFVQFTPKCRRCDTVVVVEAPLSMLPESIDLVCFVDRHRVVTVSNHYV